MTAPKRPRTHQEDLARIEAKVDGLLRVAEVLIRTQAKFVELATALVERLPTPAPMPEFNPATFRVGETPVGFRASKVPAPAPSDEEERAYARVLAEGTNLQYVNDRSANPIEPPSVAEPDPPPSDRSRQTGTGRQVLEIDPPPPEIDPPYANGGILPQYPEIAPGLALQMPAAAEAEEPYDEPVSDPQAFREAALAELYEDEEIPPPPDDDDVWRRRAAMFLQNKLWLPEWGPRPGQDGCRVPIEYLRGARR